jgi:aromatic ring-cleaving dioxygenase
MPTFISTPTKSSRQKRSGRRRATSSAVPEGRYHLRPVGPHPRGSCQLTVPASQFGEVAQWLALNRGRLTIFAHADTGDDLADHTRHVIWFGTSEPLNLAIFGQ